MLKKNLLNKFLSEGVSVCVHLPVCMYVTYMQVPVETRGHWTFWSYRKVTVSHASWCACLQRPSIWFPTLALLWCSIWCCFPPLKHPVCSFSSGPLAWALSAVWGTGWVGREGLTHHALLVQVEGLMGRCRNRNFIPIWLLQLWREWRRKPLVYFFMFFCFSF